MRQRILSAIAAVLLGVHGSGAQTRQKLNIDAATVFLNGAELNCSARLDLKKGENEILFTNVAVNVNTSSIIVNATNDVVVESAIFQNNTLTADTLTTRAKVIMDSMRQVALSVVYINNKITTLDKQIDMLDDKSDGGEKGAAMPAAELAKMLDLVNAKLEGYLNEKSRQEELRRKAEERIAKWKQQLEEEQKKDYIPGAQLLVKFFAKEATATLVIADYIMPGAGWSPGYDIMASDVSRPVQLYYKANVYQNSGIKWTNVKLSLSTGNPQEGIQAPVINPWYLSVYVPPVSENTTTAYRKPLVDRDKPGSTILSRQEINAIPTTETRDLVALSPAMYQSRRGRDVNIGGCRTTGIQYIIDGVQVTGQVQEQPTLANYVTVDNSGVNTIFDIDLPYTIPSDGRQHLVVVKKYDMAATYRHFAIPRLDKDAFLQAQVTGWEEINLLPGQANIFYENSYVGQGFLDMRNSKDTMVISLGRDKRIMVKREQDKKLRSVKTSGSNVRETFAYSIDIRNTRKEKINLVILDQAPVSNDKEVVIENLEKGNSEYEESTGFMKWAITYNANESRKLHFGYTIKYPKGKTIIGLK